MALKFYGKGRAEQILGMQRRPSPRCPNRSRGLCMLSRLRFFHLAVRKLRLQFVGENSSDGVEGSMLHLFSLYFLRELGGKRKRLIKWIEEFSQGVILLCFWFCFLIFFTRKLLLLLFHVVIMFPSVKATALRYERES